MLPPVDPQATSETRRPYTERELGFNNLDRFAIELEFVQCLGDPLYLNHLAVKKYFDDPAFVNYLKYLLYWKDPEYSQFIVYPQCLYFLEELQSKDFRDAIANITYAVEVQKQQNVFFRTFWKSRMKETEAGTGNPTDADTTETGSGSGSGFGVTARASGGGAEQSAAAPAIAL